MKWKLTKLDYIILDSENLIQIMVRKGKDNFKQLFDDKCNFKYKSSFPESTGEKRVSLKNPSPFTNF